jgi:putative (di)nucleoside polyphosphate hydrolase
MYHAMNKHYRPNVAAILLRSDGQVLIGQRSDYPETWQFPQGGIDQGETPEEAVRREVAEEVGIAPEAYTVAARSGPHRYDFPAGRDRCGHDGQEQVYFLCPLHGTDAPPIDLAGTCGEFAAVRWVPVVDFPVHLAPPMKQAVYREVLRRLFPDPEDSD